MILRRSILLGGVVSLCAPRLARAQQIALGISRNALSGGIPSIAAGALARGLAFLWLPLDGLQIDLVSGLVAPYNNSSPLPGSLGQQLSFPSAGAEWVGLQVTTLNGVGTQDFTIAALARPATGAVGFIAAQQNNIGNIEVSANQDYNGATLSGGLTFGIFDGVNTYGASTSSNIFAAGNTTYYAMAGIRSGGAAGTCNIYVNGINNTNTSTAAPNVDVRFTNTFIGSDSSGTLLTNYPIAFVGMWNRALSASEIASFQPALFSQFLSELLIWPSDNLMASGIRAVRPADAAIFVSPF